jgi:hypothetical protein
MYLDVPVLVVGLGRQVPHQRVVVDTIVEEKDALLEMPLFA